WIMVGSGWLVGGSTGPGHSDDEDAGQLLAGAAFDQQRLLGGGVRGAGGQGALLGLLPFGGVLEAEDLGEGGTAGSTVCRLSRVKISRAVRCIEASADRIRWLAQMTTANPASRKTCVGVV